MTLTPPSSSKSVGGASPFEAHETVRIVLEHDQVVCARDLDDAPAALLRERAAARVLEGRDRVEERRLVTGGERLPRAPPARGPPRPSRAARSRHRAGEDLQRAVVRRRLDEHARAGPHELLDEEVEALERPARDDDARRLDPVPLRDPLAQRRIAAARPVGEHGGPVARDRGARAVGELVDREALGRGHAAREGDETHVLRLPGRARRAPHARD